ncbi:MAG: DUF423 domain-containing protein [Puniceicoccaceae bacterium]|nr:MAG: DUF423 domain-containing protein [Puniceicoccaceae bacterium]
MTKTSVLLLIAASYGLLAVVLGAFGAHALDERLLALGTKAVWDTAVAYQMWHALAILLLVALRMKGPGSRLAPYCFCWGVPLFSGSLYWLALDGPRWLGPITPLGGLLFVAGWAALIVAACNYKDNSC